LQASFSALKSRTTFVRQAANLWQYKAMLQEKLAAQLGALDDDVHLIGVAHIHNDRG
jgi:hypothetical protein